MYTELRSFSAAVHFAFLHHYHKERSINIRITGRSVEVPPEIRSYVESKIGNISRFFDSVVDAQVILSDKRVEHIAEATLRLPGKDIHSQATAESMLAAIDLLADKLERQVVKHKGKQQNHGHESHKRMEVPSP